MGDEATETLSKIQKLEFGPQVHKTIGRRCAGKTDDSLYFRSNLHQRLKSLGLVILEGRELINDDHIVIKVKATGINQPAKVLTVNDGDVGSGQKRHESFLRCPHTDGVGQMLQVLPFCNFRRPGITGDP